MEILRGRCGHCDAELGEFVNLWTQIGKSYISPIVDAKDDGNIILQGPRRIGEQLTLVAECQLQDIACAQCKTVVGLKCLSTPTNHALDDNQLLLRQTSIVLTGDEGLKSELIINRFLKLRDAAGAGSHQDPSFSSSTGSNSQKSSRFHESHTSFSSEPVDILHIQADLDAQRDDIDRIDSAGYQIVSAFDNAVIRIEKEVKKLNDTMMDLRKEMDRNKDDIGSLRTDISDVRSSVRDNSTVMRLEGQINSTYTVVSEMRQLSSATKAETDELRKELQTAKTGLRQQQQEAAALRQEMGNAKKVAKDSLGTAKEYAKEVASLRIELKQLKHGMDQDRGKKTEPSTASFSSKELDILTSSITKIGHRASQVESLQMEFDLFKSRIQRLEASVESDHRRASRSGTDELSLVPEQSSEGQQSSEIALNSRKKRASNAREQLAAQDSTPAKRLAYSPEYSGSGTVEYESTMEWPQTSPSSTVVVNTSQFKPIGRRMTRTGAVDRRTLRYGVRSSATGDGLDSVYSPPDD